MSLEVSHRHGSYPVQIAPGALDALPEWLQARFGATRVAIISDAQVASFIRAPIPDAILLSFPAGERHKSRTTWSELTDQLIAHQFGRDSVLVALGGGVTTDLTGFVAATYLRGVPWVAVPTTTLAMVDAAIGGKTGVDTIAGKNLVGAIHHPDAVVIDPLLLATLSERHYREGLAEVVKHAAILDAAQGRWLLANADAIGRREPATLASVLRQSVELKGAVVAEDEFEQGRRAILNAGHTVAHALEQVSEFTIPHGEAVAIGLMIETRYAEAAGICASGTSAQLRALLQALALPTEQPQGLPTAALIAAMGHDKKNRGGVVRAALLARFGAVARDGDAWTLPLEMDRLEALL